MILTLAFIIPIQLKSQNFAYVEKLEISEAKRPSTSKYFKSIYYDTLAFYDHPQMELKLNIKMKDQNKLKRTVSQECNMFYSYEKNLYSETCSIVVFDILDDSTVICNIKFDDPFFELRKKKMEDDNYIPFIMQLLPTFKFVFRYDYIDEQEGYLSELIESSYIQDVNISWSNYR
jgi:hypothetical protein